MARLRTTMIGFASEEERDLFLLLIGVQSVGPKVALAIVSGSPPAELRRLTVDGSFGGSGVV